MLQPLESTPSGIIKGQHASSTCNERQFLQEMVYHPQSQLHHDSHAVSRYWDGDAPHANAELRRLLLRAIEAHPDEPERCDAYLRRPGEVIMYIMNGGHRRRIGRRKTGRSLIPHTKYTANAEVDDDEFYGYVCDFRWP